MYQGSYPASTALKGLKPSVIKSNGSTLHGSINETVWFDGQHQLRKLTCDQRICALNQGRKMAWCRVRGRWSRDRRRGRSWVTR